MFNSLLIKINYVKLNSIKINSTRRQTKHTLSSITEMKIEKGKEDGKLSPIGDQNRLCNRQGRCYFFCMQSLCVVSMQKGYINLQSYMSTVKL
jgi:hypothetical protein